MPDKTKFTAYNPKIGGPMEGGMKTSTGVPMRQWYPGAPRNQLYSAAISRRGSEFTPGATQSINMGPYGPYDFSFTDVGGGVGSNQIDLSTKGNYYRRGFPFTPTLGPTPSPTPPRGVGGLAPSTLSPPSPRGLPYNFFGMPEYPGIGRPFIETGYPESGGLSSLGGGSSFGGLGAGSGGTTWTPPVFGPVSSSGESTGTRAILGAQGDGGGAGGGSGGFSGYSPQTGGIGQMGGSYFGSEPLTSGVSSNLGPTSSQQGLPQGLYSGLGSPLTAPGMSGPPGGLGSSGPVSAGALGSSRAFSSPRTSIGGNYVRFGYNSVMPMAQYQQQFPQGVTGTLPRGGTSGTTAPLRAVQKGTADVNPGLRIFRKQLLSRQKSPNKQKHNNNQ